MTVEAVIKVLLENAARARALVKGVAPRLAPRKDACEAGCNAALEVALITAKETRDPAFVKKLRTVAGRVLER